MRSRLVGIIYLIAAVAATFGWLWLIRWGIWILATLGIALLATALLI